MFANPAHLTKMSEIVNIFVPLFDFNFGSWLYFIIKLNLDQTPRKTIRSAIHWYYMESNESFFVNRASL